MCFTLHFSDFELSFFLVHMLALLLHPASSSEDILILPLYRCSHWSYNGAAKLLELRLGPCVFRSLSFCCARLHTTSHALIAVFLICLGP